MRDKVLDALGRLTTWAWNKLLDRVIRNGTYIVGPTDEWENPAR